MGKLSLESLGEVPENDFVGSTALHILLFLGASKFHCLLFRKTI